MQLKEETWQEAIIAGIAMITSCVVILALLVVVV